MDIKAFLRTLTEKDGSDLYISVGATPSAKFQGKLTPLSDTVVTTALAKQMAYDLMEDWQIKEFEEELEMNLAISPEPDSRYRVNIFQQRNDISMVIRNIKTEIPNADKLGLPQVLKDVITAKRGLILFVGGTGSGKSTSLAALIDHRNATSGGHIITIEDPVEYVHPHKMSIINQREVGVDTHSYAAALKNTLRQAPDVILIGEIRDAETMEHALAFAETGHLAISTLHANNANQALDRIVNFFPEERHKQLYSDLALNLQAFVSQRLVKTVDGGRVAAIEILIGTPMIQDLILKGDVQAIKEIMEKSENVGMQTFDRALFKLYKEGRVSLDEALKNADSPNNLRLMIKLADEGGSSDDNGLNLSLQKSEEEEAEEEQDSVSAGDELPSVDGLQLRSPTPPAANPSAASTPSQAPDTSDPLNLFKK